MGVGETRERYSDGDVIIREGQIGDRMYVVLSGAVRILRSDRGVETMLADLSEGEIFGELALFDNRPRSASARAMGDTEVRVITQDDFLSLECDPVIREMLSTLARRMRDLDDAFERVAAREAPERERLATQWETRDWPE
jgi:CRP-like cAMP-binding protein